MSALLLAALLAQTPDGGAPPPLNLRAIPAITAARAEALIFSDEAKAPSSPRCDGLDGPARIRCLLSLRFKADPAAEKVVLELYARLGTVTGLTQEQDFDGGFRGMIRLVPDLPIGAKRKHLEWVAQGLFEHDALLSSIARRSVVPLPYRWQALELTFCQSVKRRTPAAFASDWAVTYNTAGTLNWGPDIVRELLFHELFHLNDQTHRGWSHRALSDVYQRIVGRCGTAKACLQPYAPVETATKGTWYAFLPANGVGEYAAELAARYGREQRAAQRGEKVKDPFKCRNKDNAEAWGLLVKEFFGGVDDVPPCPR